MNTEDQERFAWERAAKEAAREACEDWKQRAERAEAERDALRQDAERLDWLEAQADDWTYKNQKAWNLRAANFLSLREAIDAALAQEKGK